MRTEKRNLPETVRNPLGRKAGWSAMAWEELGAVTVRINRRLETPKTDFD